MQNNDCAIKLRYVKYLKRNMYTKGFYIYMFTEFKKDFYTELKKTKDL